MLGAIAGDVIGSVHENTRTKTKDFPLFVAGSTFTDDTVLTVAVAESLRAGIPYDKSLREWGRRYPNAGYGSRFQDWLQAEGPEPYQSFGNGSAMRVAPVAWARDDLDSVLMEARRSAEVTHDHPEGIKGAQAVAAAIFLARRGSTKDEIRREIEGRFGYACAGTVDRLRPDYEYDVTCQGTVPAALVAFFDSRDFEDSIRNAISLGGDADTLACITGAIAEAFYGGVPPEIASSTHELLDAPLRAAVTIFALEMRIRVGPVSGRSP